MMNALLVSRIHARDPDRLKAYSLAAGPTILAHGGEIIARGQFDSTLLGETGPPHATGVIRFPSVEAAQAWFNSPEYIALSDLREAAGNMEFYLYQSL